MKAAALVVAAILAAGPVQAQTLTVLHTFTGGSDGGQPIGTLTMDRAGNLYGTASKGGFAGFGCFLGCGSVFKLTQVGSNWLFAPLYSFQGESDGSTPYAGVTIGPNGSLYGTTGAEGTQDGGTVYNLQPSLNHCGTPLCPWRETVLHRFTGNLGNGDGAYPAWGSVVFDSAGNLYGTAAGGGANNDGAVYELTHTAGGWTESVLYSFTGQGDGSDPVGGLVIGAANHLYGTTENGDVEDGCVYELTNSGSGWTENTLFNFYHSVAGAPEAGMTMDRSGNLYGTTVNAGTVFELAPSGGGWTFTLVWYFGYLAGPNYGPMFFDAAGNLYGASGWGGSYDDGFVFKLTPSQNGWTRTDLYDFTGNSDGSHPTGGLVLDASGNIYGTTFDGGAGGQGTVFKLTP
jgi:uncharacterized repeat protein (TIGR03803 family)